jgi:hypothetical protein
MFASSALRTKAKTTLPSNEGWLDTNHITKDPPKSIHTRRKIKVGENNDILNMREDAGDRSVECISAFPKAVNPMVDVQYALYGNNGGTKGSSGKHPYRILDNGAFRPPIRRQEDLLPLSRMPRKCTSIPASFIFSDKRTLARETIEYFETGKFIKDLVNQSTSSKPSFRNDDISVLNVDRLITDERILFETKSNASSLFDQGFGEFILEGGQVCDNHKTISVETNSTSGASRSDVRDAPISFNHLSFTPKNDLRVSGQTGKTSQNFNDNLTNKTKHLEPINVVSVDGNKTMTFHNQQQSDQWYLDKVHEALLSHPISSTQSNTRHLNQHRPKYDLVKNIPSHDIKGSKFQRIEKPIQSDQRNSFHFRSQKYFPDDGLARPKLPTLNR